MSPAVVFISTITLERSWLPGRVERRSGTGSGFVWDVVGGFVYIVTNFHVVGENSQAIRVKFKDGHVYDASLVGGEPEQDIAVLRLAASPGMPIARLPIGTSSDLRVGQRVFAIGNPFGLQQTLTTGIVSALNRTIDNPRLRTSIEGVIQTDAAINPGNSGGPLLDSSGRLIGVNTAIISPTGSSAGIGFAVPVDTVNEIVPQLIRLGRVSKPRLGITTLPDQDNSFYTSGLGVEGVVVGQVIAGSPAAEAGLRGLSGTPSALVLGDIILRLGGSAVRSPSELRRELSRRKIGEEVELEVLREGRRQLLRLTLRDVAQQD